MYWKCYLFCLGLIAAYADSKNSYILKLLLGIYVENANIADEEETTTKAQNENTNKNKNPNSKVNDGDANKQ